MHSRLTSTPEERRLGFEEAIAYALEKAWDG
jgi:hypothetical protein